MSQFSNKSLVWLQTELESTHSYYHYYWIDHPPHTSEAAERFETWRAGRGRVVFYFLCFMVLYPRPQDFFPIKNGKSPRDDVDGAFQWVVREQIAPPPADVLWGSFVTQRTSAGRLEGRKPPMSRVMSNTSVRVCVPLLTVFFSTKTWGALPL